MADADMALNKEFAHALMEKVTELKMQYWGKALDTVGENVLIVSEAEKSLLLLRRFFKPGFPFSGVFT
jgi:hypothetical protein